MRSGFLDIYPGKAVSAHLQSLMSDYATNQELVSWCVSSFAVCRRADLIWYLQDAHGRVRSVRVGVGEKLLAEKGKRTAGIRR